MSMAKITWVWTIAALSGICIARTKNQHTDDRQLSYDVSSKVPYPTIPSAHQAIRNPQEFSVHSSLGRSVSSLNPSVAATPRFSRLSQSNQEREPDISSLNSLYYSLISNKKKGWKRREKCHPFLKVDRRQDRKQRPSVTGHSTHKKADPVDESELIFYPHSTIKDLAEAQNIIYSRGKIKTNPQGQKSQASNHLLTTANPSLFLESSVNVKPSEVTTQIPWRKLSKVPTTLQGKNFSVTRAFSEPRIPLISQDISLIHPKPQSVRRGPGTLEQDKDLIYRKVPSLTRVPESPLNTELGFKKAPSQSRYPYSTTFHSFDSFLNTIGTSFKLDGGSHAIRTRSEDGPYSLQESVESENSGHAGTIQIDDENASQSSQELYENNDLGIDVLHEDKETFLNMPERCCGSKVPFDPKNAKAIGGFSRVAAAGSIKVIEVPDKDTDILPPSVIRDLKITVTGPRTIRMEWTVPGDDLDQGKVSGYVVRLSDTRYDLREIGFDQGVTFTEVDLDDLLEASGVFQDAGTAVKVTFNVDERVLTRLQAGQQYYVALRALDDFNNTSPVSNVATFTLPTLGQRYILNMSTTATFPQPSTDTTNTPPTTTTTTVPPPTTTTAASTSREYISSESEEMENQIVPIVTLEGRVVPNTKEEEPKKRKKDRKGKGKSRKHKGKGKKGRRHKGRKASSNEVSTTPTTSAFDPSVYISILENIQALKDSFQE